MKTASRPKAAHDQRALKSTSAPGGHAVDARTPRAVDQLTANELRELLGDIEAEMFFAEHLDVLLRYCARRARGRR